MRKFIYLGMIGVPFLFFGCIDPATPLPQFTPTALESQGKGITIANSTPYNCKILGEVEGKDDASGTQGVISEKLREGAINDLKNEAGATAPNKRIMLRITNEKVQCRGLVRNQTRDFDCTNGIPKGVTNVIPISHRIHAEVFECGDK